MYTDDLVQKITQKISGTEVLPVPEKFVRDPAPQIRVPAAKLKDVCQKLKSDPDFLFDFPNNMTVVDYIQDNIFELVYFLYSSVKKHGLVVKSQIPRVDAKIDSVSNIWSGFDWQEREVYDLMGITFIGHPNLTRIMMWEGFPGHPLRKDYVHITDKYDSGLEVGTPGLDAKGVPVKQEGANG